MFVYYFKLGSFLLSLGREGRDGLKIFGIYTTPCKKRDEKPNKKQVKNYNFPVGLTGLKNHRGILIFTNTQQERWATKLLPRSGGFFFGK